MNRNMGGDMGKIVDITGRKFGLLTAVSVFDQTARGDTRWLCQCKCGHKSVHRGDHLRSGHVNSCGCMKIKALLEEIEKVKETRSRPFNGEEATSC